MKQFQTLALLFLGALVSGFVAADDRRPGKGSKAHSAPRRQGQHPGRANDQETTVHINVGNGLVDLFAAKLAYESLGCVDIHFTERRRREN